jgi:transposase
MRYTWALNMMTINRQSLVFVDEAGFNLHIKRSKGWSPTCERATVGVANQRGGNISIAGALTINGLQHFNVKEGAFNKESFETFCEQLCRKLFLLSNTEYVIILDNLPFHHSQVISEVFERYHYRIWFLPPYLQFLNLIEYAWNSWKVPLKRKNIIDKTILMEEMVNASINITSDKAESWFNHIFDYYIPKCLNRSQINT